MMEYYSLKDKKKEPLIGRMYRIIVDGDEAIPVVVSDIFEAYKGMIIEYYAIDDPEHMITDSVSVFCEWYGEW